MAAHGDGHVLAVTVAMLLAILTGRCDMCIAGVFGARKTRSLAVLLIVLSCELTDFTAIVYTKENEAAKALADQLCDLAPPTLGRLGRLIGLLQQGRVQRMCPKIRNQANHKHKQLTKKKQTTTKQKTKKAKNKKQKQKQLDNGVTLVNKQTILFGTISAP